MKLRKLIQIITKLRTSAPNSESDEVESLRTELFLANKEKDETKNFCEKLSLLVQEADKTRSEIADGYLRKLRMLERRRASQNEIIKETYKYAIELGQKK